MSYVWNMPITDYNDEHHFLLGCRNSCYYNTPITSIKSPHGNKNFFFLMPNFLRSVTQKLSECNWRSQVWKRSWKRGVWMWTLPIPSTAGLPFTGQPREVTHRLSTYFYRKELTRTYTTQVCIFIVGFKLDTKPRKFLKLRWTGLGKKEKHNKEAR